MRLKENAVVHCKYAFSGSILIKIFSDRVEFISPGGLVHGIEIGNIMSGYSTCRNPAVLKMILPPAERLLGVSQTSAGIVLRGMVESGELIKQGNSRNVRYFVDGKMTGDGKI